MSSPLSAKDKQELMDTFGALVAVLDSASIETPASEAARVAAGNAIRLLADDCPTCVPPGNTPPPP